MKNIHMMLSGLILITPSFASMAEDDHFYLGGSFGLSHYSGEGPVAIFFQPDQTFSDDDGTFSLFAGYHLNDLISFELGYADYGTATDNFGLNPAFRFAVAPLEAQRVGANGVYFSALVGPHFDNGLSLFLELGFSHMEFDVESFNDDISIPFSLTDVDSSDNGFLFGVGARYTITDRVSARLQWRGHIMDRLDIDTATLGIEVGF